MQQLRQQALAPVRIRLRPRRQIGLDKTYLFGAPVLAVQGLVELATRAGIAPDAPAPVLASAIDFVLEGLYSQKKIGRSDDRGYHGTEPVRRPAVAQRTPLITQDEDDDEQPKKKKRYYN